MWVPCIERPGEVTAGMTRGRKFKTRAVGGRVIPHRALRGSWAQSLSVSPISLITGNSLHSASMTFPEFQQGRFKQLLIREGRGCEIREKQCQEKQQCSLGAGSWFPINGHTQQYP